MKKIAKTLFTIIFAAVIFLTGATCAEQLALSVNGWYKYLIIAVIILVVIAIGYFLGRGSKTEEAEEEIEE